MSIGITYSSMRREIGRHLGLDRNPANWAPYTVVDVDDIIRNGMAMAFRPPALPGEHSSHQWSFLNPITHMKLQPGVEDYVLGEDFGGLAGDLYFTDENGVLADKICYTGVNHILTLRAQDDFIGTTHHPRWATIVSDIQQGLEEQRSKLMVWPCPDEAYSVTFQYYVRIRELSDSNPKPPGGDDHAALFRAAILAAIELDLEDQHGPQYQNFMQQLQASVSRDRALNMPSSLGYNGDGPSMGAGPYTRVPNPIRYSSEDF